MLKRFEKPLSFVLRWTRRRRFFPRSLDCSSLRSQPRPVMISLPIWLICCVECTEHLNYYFYFWNWYNLLCLVMFTLISFCGHWFSFSFYLTLKWICCSVDRSACLRKVLTSIRLPAFIKHYRAQGFNIRSRTREENPPFFKSPRGSWTKDYRLRETAIWTWSTHG